MSGLPREQSLKFAICLFYSCRMQPGLDGSALGRLTAMGTKHLFPNGCSPVGCHFRENRFALQRSPAPPHHTL
jgi:hypothetical protein